MKDRIEKNINRIEELTDELIDIYHKRAGQREIENVDRIRAEIKTRTILDKLYTHRELSESNLLSLHKYVCEFNNKKNDYYNVYNEFEKTILLSCYDVYENEINQIIESKDNIVKQKSVFSRIRKKVVNNHRR